MTRSRFRQLSPAARRHARVGLNAIVGSPFRVKQIQDGKDGVICPFCKTNDTPIVSPNGNLNCNGCEALLYDGPNDKAVRP